VQRATKPHQIKQIKKKKSLYDTETLELEKIPVIRLVAQEIKEVSYITREKLQTFSS